MNIPAFQPRQGVKIHVSDAEAKEDQGGAQTDAEELESMIKSLPAPGSLAGYRMVPHEFEKDDDTNFHMDYITAVRITSAVNSPVFLN